MADNVKLEVDLATGKLVLECPESSVDSILTRVADFLPKFRDQARPPVLPHAPHHPQQGVGELTSHHPGKPARAAVESVPKKRTSATGRTGTSLDTRQEVQGLQLDVDEPSLAPWKALGKDWKKYLWILEAARLKKIDGLTNAEISYLMEKTFREVRQPKVVNNLKKKIKERFVASQTIESNGKSYAIWKILADGSKEVVQQTAAASV
jgi:hypothetical protein